MIIGIPKEIKTHEYRVAVTPPGAKELVREGHRVLVEGSAGSESGFPDKAYLEAGAEITDKGKVFAQSELIVKVKEPLPPEYGLLREGQAIFTFLHLAPNPELTDVLLRKKITALGYETLEKNGTLPLLQPMSEIAGRMSPLIASYYLQKTKGGSGILPSGIAGVAPANTLILGAGTVGTNAARVACGIGMKVTVINKGIERLQRLDEAFGGRVSTLTLTSYNIEKTVKEADIVIGAVMEAGRRAPVLVTKDMVYGMKKGSVIVDVSIDQGGSVETSRPTTHDEPVYEIAGVIHYAVTNMPGAYPMTATSALTERTLPYIKALASMGIEKAIRENEALKTSLNLYRGRVVHKGLSESTGLPPGEI